MSKRALVACSAFELEACEAVNREANVASRRERCTWPSSPARFCFLTTPVRALIHYYKRHLQS